YGLRRDIYRDAGARILDSLARTPRFNHWMADTIRPFVGKRVLEIGAGIGNLSEFLSMRRESYTATDVDQEHLARLSVRFQGRPNVHLRRCNLDDSEDFSALAGQVNTVICLNVLEHIADDDAALRNIRTALVPGGRAIILVPQDQSIYGTLDKVLGHCRRYSEPELRSKIQAAGLELERVIHFNRATRPGWYLNGRVLRRTNFSRFQLWLFDRFVWLWRRIDHLLPWPSVSLIAIARRR
ncbi:MAG: class I SAM-dependent methyltransferase, partial [Acidobacteriia bacterium]|nr:class I SAM-dependent methyltransferase [Terriglobia bacterium]